MCLDLELERVELDVKFRILQVWKTKDGIIVIYHGGDEGYLIKKF